ncbi:di-heme oxidoredictase family protein, partial [Sinorhizobium sp. CB9]|uniref:di-heme oxidoredictase family protein n=1 Tax=Sinorhizobium sp. CB9 TaxID=3056948 RepID=UPI00352617E2
HKFPELAHQDIQPFTDLLLHDMGEGLKDDSGNEKARLWRTAPLWGLKDVRAANNSRQDEFRPGDVSIVW